MGLVGGAQGLLVNVFSTEKRCWCFGLAEAGARRAGLEGAGPCGPQCHPPGLRRGEGGHSVKV